MRSSKRRSHLLRTAAMACLALSGLAAESRAETMIIRAKRIFPVSSKPIENGMILVRDGKIVELGQEVSVRPDGPGVRVIDVPGCVVPGFIDCGSDIGVAGRPAEEWSELTPEARVLDAVDFDHAELELAFHEGVTTVAVSPGPRNVIGGRGVILRTGRRLRTGGPAVLERDAFVDVSMSDEAAAGNFNLRSARPYTYTFRLPNTRMGTVFLARRAFFEALDVPGPDDLPNLLAPEGRTVLRGALEGSSRIRIHADTRQEILAALRLAEEFHASIQIVGGREAAEAIPRLAAGKIALILYPGNNPGDERPELYPSYTVRLPELLSAAGAPFAYGSSDGDEVQLLRERASMALRFGLSAESALHALTLGAARILGVERRTGSLEPGKDADMVALSGAPLEITSSILWSMAGGRLDRDLERSF